MTDYRDLLIRYLAHVRRIERGRHLLEDGCMAPFAPDEIRHLSDARQFNPSAPLVERLGGNTQATSRTANRGSPS